MRRSFSTIKLSVIFFIVLSLVSTSFPGASVAEKAPSKYLWVWGDNDGGQLGNEINTDTYTPILVRNIPEVAAVAAGGLFTLALDSYGYVWAWGVNQKGQLGNETMNIKSNVPVQVSNLSGITAIDTGDEHGLALDADGRVWAWGGNTLYQLGNDTYFGSSTPAQVNGLPEVVAIAAGYMHNLALDSNGNVWAWGANFEGQLGGNGELWTDSSTPILVAGIAGVKSISGGADHNLALDVSGNVWAWGGNEGGQLGNATTTRSLTPVKIDGLPEIKQILAGGGYSLALDTNGAVWAWGGNGLGTLGDGTQINRPIPSKVSNLTGITVIAGGCGHNLALDSNGLVWAWGGNLNGQIGNGTHTGLTRWGTDSGYVGTPVQVLNLTGVTAIAGGAYHSLALGTVPQQACETSTTTSLAETSLSAGRVIHASAFTANTETCGSQPSGAVTFQWSGDGGLTWSKFAANEMLDSSGNASIATVPPGAGAFYFRAVYGGDTFHNWSKSGDADALLIVTKAPTTVTAQLSTDRIRVSEQVSCSMTITTPAVYSPRAPKGKWAVQASRDSTFSTGVVTLGGGTVTGDFPFTITTKPFSPVYPGAIYIRAIYTGDDNYMKSWAANVLTVVR